MKKINYFLVFVSCLTLHGLISCTEDAISPVLDSENVLDIDELSNPYRVTADCAKEQAIAFASQMQTVTRLKGVNNEVESVIPWLSKDIWTNDKTRGNASVGNLPDTALYIVNMKNKGGYALVSADSRVPGVMAFIENGSFSPEDEITNPGFRTFLNGLEAFLSREMSNTPSLPQGSNDPYYVFSITKEPMLTTNWGQRSPYNNYCFTPSGSHAPAGCEAIAIAQIAAYYEWPDSYNNHTYDWESILTSDTVDPNNSVASNSVAHLVHDIGVLVDMDYNVNGSGATFDDVMDCWDAFNYFYEPRTLPTFEAVDSTLQEDCPVFYCGMNFNLGAGHAWVIDGSAVQRGFVRIFGPSGMLTETIEILHLSFVHCNWGWNGIDNGYFLFGAFNSQYDEDTGELTEFYYAFNSWNQCYLSIYPDYSVMFLN